MNTAANRFLRLSKTLSWILGIIIFTFGFLKFFSPIDGWFETQIVMSHLPREAILFGKLGEMATGCLFVLPWLWQSLRPEHRRQFVLLACLALVVQMGTAIYVHLQPEVPASVLPLGIKPPVIPVSILLLALLAAFASWKGRQAERSSGFPVHD